ncbi:MAG: MATE family efflux transporter [Clostridia bacterium]|nr:MATE family efflux transporter [Clostridia bacterium]
MKNNVNMTQGNALGIIIRFAVPIMLSSLLQYNYHLVDNILVGRFVGTDALAAVGNVGSVNSFIIGAALGLTAGFTIPVAHSFGAGDAKRASHFAGNSITVSFIIGCIIVVTAHIISTPLLRLIGTPDEIIGLSAAYVNILYFAVPIQMLSNNFTAIARAVGESKKPLYFFIVSVITNFFLDLLFIGKFGWGVEGAAAATLISHAVPAVLCGIYIFRFNKNIEIKRSDLRLDLKTAGYQIKLGVPISLQFTITSIGSMCMQSAVNSFGANVIAGITAANRVENLTNIPMSGLGVATQTFVAQNFGARKYDRILDSVKKILILDIAVSIVMSLTLYFAGPYVVSLFMKELNPEIMQISKRYILAIAQCYSLVAVLFVLRNSLQGLGFTYSNMIAGAGELAGRISVAFVFSRIIGLTAIFYAPPAAWLLADIPLAVIFIIQSHKMKQKMKDLPEKQQDAPSQAVKAD